MGLRQAQLGLRWVLGRVSVWFVLRLRCVSDRSALRLHWLALASKTTGKLNFWLCVCSLSVLCAFTVRSAFVYRPFCVRLPSVLRSFTVCSAFVYRPFSVRLPSVQRAFTVCSPFNGNATGTFP